LGSPPEKGGKKKEKKNPGINPGQPAGKGRKEKKKKKPGSNRERARKKKPWY
jgi:hypothetical protein